MKNFGAFISQLSETNSTLDYFTNFVKIKYNLSEISIRLNQLNFLIGKKDLKNAVEQLFKENPRTFEVLAILVAVRNANFTKVISNQLEVVSLDSYFSSPALILEYLEGTGLAEIFREGEVKNLVDYVFGIEVGLDTNARKNRSGDYMSKTISRIFDKAGIFYKKEVKSTNFPEITGFGADIKDFDFAIRTKSITYLVEVNYYNTGGSKLNEVARSYSDIAPKVNKQLDYRFVWITDGQGWLSAKNQLKEAFGVIPDLYNLATIKDFLCQVQREGLVANW